MINYYVIFIPKNPQEAQAKKNEGRICKLFSEM